MRLITRRYLLGVLASLVGLVLAGESALAAAKGVGESALESIIKVDKNSKICEREAKAKIEKIINDMLDAAENMTKQKISDSERRRIVGEAWKRNRQLILTRYSFKD